MRQICRFENGLTDGPLHKYHEKPLSLVKGLSSEELLQWQHLSRGTEKLKKRFSNLTLAPPVLTVLVSEF